MEPASRPSSPLVELTPLDCLLTELVGLTACEGLGWTSLLDWTAVPMTVLLLDVMWELLAAALFVGALSCLCVCALSCLCVGIGGEVELLTIGDTRTVGFTLSLALISLEDVGKEED